MATLPIPVLYTYTTGEGPDVVLVHGWGMHSGVWEDVVESLIDYYRVTVLDLPGHGYGRGLSGAGSPSVVGIGSDSSDASASDLGGLVAGGIDRPTGCFDGSRTTQPTGTGQ